jgi:hypothetical protein
MIDRTHRLSMSRQAQLLDISRGAVYYLPKPTSASDLRIMHVRYEWLSQYYWSSLQEVQAFATRWMWSYNHDRPNMALGGFTPKQKLAMAA